MKWSKLKQRLEERFAPEVAGRISLLATRYRESHDAEGELLVTLDGEKIYGAGYYDYLLAFGAAKRRGTAADVDVLAQQREINRQLSIEGIEDNVILMKAAFDSLSQSIEEMLASPHVLLRGLAVLDARCGKRRLAKIDTAAEHPFVARLYALRLAA